MVWEMPILTRGVTCWSIPPKMQGIHHHVVPLTRDESSDYNLNRGRKQNKNHDQQKQLNKPPPDPEQYSRLLSSLCNVGHDR